jgi:hypothetical protein
MGRVNTATGASALTSNTLGNNNTATGDGALNSNTTGGDNTVTGVDAAHQNIGGSNNTVNGFDALFSNTSGHANTADGFRTLYNNTGGTNIAVGYLAGQNLTTGNCNIDIGNQGQVGESNTIRIGTQTVEGCGQTATFIAGIINFDASAGVPVYILPTGQLGHGPIPVGVSSTARGTTVPWLFAQDITRMEPSSAMQELKATVAEQQKEIKVLTAALKEQASQIQKVSAQLELNKPEPRTVLNNQ